MNARIARSIPTLLIAAAGAALPGCTTQRPPQASAPHNAASTAPFPNVAQRQATGGVVNRGAVVMDQRPVVHTQGPENTAEPAENVTAQAQATQGEPANGGIEDASKNTGDGDPSSGAPVVAASEVETAQDGWNLVQTAASAEDAPLPEEPRQPQTPSGPNMAAKLYGDLLGTSIPANGNFQGQQTINIRQISFTHEGSDFDPQVSRDGRSLVFSSTQHSPTADVYIKGVGSRVLTRLTQNPGHDVMPTLSPDNQRIAFASNRSGNWDIWMMPSSGGKAVQVTSEASHDLHPSFSPDGNHVVFCRLGQTSGRWELWVADVFDNASSQFIGYGLFPEWCPVGGTGADGADQILFQRSRERGERTFGVWTLDFNTSTVQAGRETQIASDPEHALINPSWSPNGDRIAYAAVPNPQAWIGDGATALPPSAAIWMLGIDGRGEVPLTSGDSIDLMPAWSSQGQVLFVSDRSGVENLWAIDIAPAILAATGEDPRTNGRRMAEQNGENEQDGDSQNQPSVPSSFVSVPTDTDQ